MALIILNNSELLTLSCCFMDYYEQNIKSELLRKTITGNDVLYRSVFDLLGHSNNLRKVENKSISIALSEIMKCSVTDDLTDIKDSISDYMTDNNLDHRETISYTIENEIVSVTYNDGHRFHIVNNLKLEIAENSIPLFIEIVESWENNNKSSWAISESKIIKTQLIGGGF